MDGSLQTYLQHIRAVLVAVWNDETRHPGTPRRATDPVSKGQCGVTSLYLAWQLIAQNYDVLYCEGDVRFPDPFAAIHDHCWLKIRQDNMPVLLVDLAADQNGHAAVVIAATEAHLQENGIIYTAQKERRLDKITHDNLLQRCQILTERIRHSTAHTIPR